MSTIDDAVLGLIRDELDNYDFSNLTSDIIREVLDDSSLPSKEDMADMDSKIDDNEEGITNLEIKFDKLVELLDFVLTAGGTGPVTITVNTIEYIKTILTELKEQS